MLILGTHEFTAKLISLTTDDKVPNRKAGPKIEISPN